LFASTGFLSDQLIEFTGQAGDKCPYGLRRIVAWHAEKQEEIVFLTNMLEFGASTIADIYKDRWQIELFFKALKQNLKVKTFVGTTENALYIQIWTALIAILLLKYLQFRSALAWALSNLPRKKREMTQSCANITEPSEADLERLPGKLKRHLALFRELLGLPITSLPEPQEAFLRAMGHPALYIPPSWLTGCAPAPGATPAPVVIKETQRTFTYLNLYGYSTDLVACNRLIPKQVTDHYFDFWKTNQEQYYRDIEDRFVQNGLKAIEKFLAKSVERARWLKGRKMKFLAE
jgi:hypothetical protein